MAKVVSIKCSNLIKAQRYGMDGDIYICFPFNTRCGIWGSFWLSTAVDYDLPWGLAGACYFPIVDSFYDCVRFGILGILQRVKVRALRGVSCWLFVFDKQSWTNKKQEEEIRCPDDEDHTCPKERDGLWLAECNDNITAFLLCPFPCAISGVEGMEEGWRRVEGKRTHRAA